jgi:YVTN family beta-propeller protein
LAGRDDTMEFRILGPFEVSEGGRPLEVGAGKQRALLALLVLSAGEVVSTDRLIDALWEEHPPASALNSVHIYVSQLRKALLDGRLETRGQGYLLALEPEQLDLGRFERLVGEGRALLAEGEPERAAEVLRAALALWRGPPLSDFASEPFAQGEIARLEELRLAALEERIEADLALGRHAELIPELEALVRAQPLRERPRAQLMLALYRSGRQAEALDAYQQARRMLAEDLGLEPGRRLQELEGAILRQDAQLDLPGNRARARIRARRRSGMLIAVGAVLLLSAAIAVAVIELTGTDSPGLEIPANALGLIDAHGESIDAEIPVDAAPTSVAHGEGAIWVTNANDGTVSRIDPVTRTVRQTIGVGSTPSGIAVGAGAVWVANHFDGTISRIDPETNTEVDKIPVGNDPTAVAYGEGSVWVTNSTDRTVSRIDPASGLVVGRPIKTDAVGRGIAVGAGSVWVTDESSRKVVRIDPETNAVAETIGVGNGPTGIAFGERAVWVANSLDGTVSRIDPQSAVVTDIVTVGGGPGTVAVGNGAVWVSAEFGQRLVRIDPDAADPKVVGDVGIGNRPKGLVVSGERVWVAVQESGQGHRGGRLIALKVGGLGDSIDPQVGSFGTGPDGSLVYDGLTGFRRTGGGEGTQLLPNLATSLPDPRDGGRSYTFRLRPGIRYSDGRRVRPEDFRRGLERAYELDGLVVEGTALTAVLGGDSCSKGRRCDLSKGVVTTGDTVTFRLSKPAPFFLSDLSYLYPIPAATPSRDVGTKPVPGTGPYAIESFVPHRQIKLVRNPHFRVWSEAARPAANPDEIVFRLETDHAQAVTAVLQGKADVLLGLVASRGQIERLRVRHSRQLHIEPQRATWSLFLDTAQPPFNDVRVRQALNYAVDRRRLVELGGGPAVRLPTCQMIPPTVLGYVPNCPYTLDPRSTGQWTAPDVAKARQLIAASGRKGQKVRVRAWREVGKEARYLVSVLRRLGYRAQLEELKDWDAYAPTIFDPKTRPQSGIIGWYVTQYGSGTIDLFRCGFSGNLARFCDRGFDRKAARARNLYATDPEGAARIWAQLDRELVDEAPYVPLFTPRWPLLASKRVGNWQYHPSEDVLFDQLWVR